MRQYILVVMALLLIAFNSQAQELKKNCTNLHFADINFPKSIHAPVNPKFEACIETISSPARLLLRGPAIISLTDLKSGSAEVVSYLNKYRARNCTSHRFHVAYDAVKFRRRTDNKIGVVVSIDGNGSRCSDYRWSYYFTIDYPILLHPSGTSIGLKVEEPVISRRGIVTHVTDWVSFNTVRNIVAAEAENAAREFNEKIAAIESRLRDYDPKITSPKINVSTDTIVVNFHLSIQMKSVEVRDRLVRYFESLTADDPALTGSVQQQ